MGQVLAEDVYAPASVPPFANSAMDGFAVRASDTPATLRVVADQAAGHVTDQVVSDGTAIRIMTGAAMPAGADSVVPVEDTEMAGPDMVRVPGVALPGANVRAAGEDIREGQRVLSTGTALNAAMIGVLASIGRGFRESTPGSRCSFHGQWRRAS